MANWTDRFQPVEYISSVGYQFTNTLVKSAPDIRIDARIKYDPFISSASYHGVNVEDNKLYIGKNASGKFSFGYADLDIASSVDADSNLHKFSIDCKNKKYSIDGVETSITGSGEFTGGEYIYMFGSNDGNFEATSNTSKIYGFNIYKNDILIRHFVPVKALSASRNLITHALTYNQYTDNGITIDQNGDYFYINGTATADAVINVDERESHFIQQLDGGNFTACTSVDIPEGLSITFSIYQFNMLSEELFTLDSTHPTGTAEIEITSAMRNYTKIVVSFKVANGDTVNVDNLALQLERGDTSNGYEPHYANSVGLMYETVEGKVYIDDYIGTYATGPSVKIIDSVKAISIMKDGDPKSVKKIERNGKLIWSNWRSNFDELEYIQSTGTQYIDTGFCPNQNSSIEAEHKINSFPQQYNAPYGTRVSNTKQLQVIYADNNNARYDFRYGNKDTYIQNGKDITTRRVVKQDKNICYIDGTQVATIAANIFDTTYPMYLFATNAENSASFNSAMTLYNAKLSDNGTTVRSLVPTKAKAKSINLLKRPVGNESASSGITWRGLADRIIAVSGTSTANWTNIYNETAFDENLPAGTYTFSIKNSLPYSLQLRLRRPDNTLISTYIPANETSVTFTTDTETTKSWVFYSCPTNTATRDEVVEPMLVAGSSVKPYEPYYTAGTAGLYDLATDRFYINSGTGAFTAGPLK